MNGNPISHYIKKMKKMEKIFLCCLTRKKIYKQPTMLASPIHTEERKICLRNKEILRNRKYQFFVCLCDDLCVSIFFLFLGKNLWSQVWCNDTTATIIDVFHVDKQTGCPHRRCWFFFSSNHEFFDR